jgi:hypothetical protein
LIGTTEKSPDHMESRELGGTCIQQVQADLLTCLRGEQQEPSPSPEVATDAPSRTICVT